MQRVEVKDIQHITTRVPEMVSSPPLTLPTFKNDELLFNYHDAVIYGSDLALIERREWLNDSCIHFFFTLLQRQQQINVQTIDRSILFMDPSVVSFWMHLCTDEDEIDDFVKSTPFPGRGNNQNGMIFIAVNDKMSAHSSSYNNAWQVSGNGSHWSLLVIETVSMKNLRFWHFDSVHNSGNIQAAEDIAAKLCLYVYPDALIATKSHEKLVRQAETPKQVNGYDCGVHVLGAARIFSKYACTIMPTSDRDNSGTSESSDRRLQDLEKCLRHEVGDDSQDFCSKLRHEISSEIRRLHREIKEG